MKTINAKYCFGWALGVLLACSSCVKENLDKQQSEFEGAPDLFFAASVFEPNRTPETRAIGDKPEYNEHTNMKASEIFVSADAFGVPYYIRKEVVAEDKDSGYQKTDDQNYWEILAPEKVKYGICGIYQVADGWVGRLSEMGTDNKLKWENATSYHNFYGWTLPWLAAQPKEALAIARGDGTDGKEGAKVYTPSEEQVVALGSKSYPVDTKYTQANYDKAGASGDVILIPFDQKYYEQLEKTDYFDPETDAANCKILEKFIGTRAGYVNYQTNGEYVKLQFRHMVSKVRIASLEFARTDGSVTKVVRGKMILKGLPRVAQFHPRPDNGDYFNTTDGNVRNAVGGDVGLPSRVPANHRFWNGSPYVEWTDDLNATYGVDVAYDISEGAEFYVCPEWDFSNMDFEVYLTFPELDAKISPFKGSFKDVTFKRHEGENSSAQDWDNEQINDQSVLHAGEIMALYLHLKESTSGSLGVEIQDWNSDSWRTGSTKPHKGIYDASDWDEVLENITKSFNPEGTFETNYWDDDYKDLSDGTTKSSKGDNDDQVLPRIKFLEDVDLTKTSNPSELPSGDNYVIDGMGHTVKMTPEGGKIKVGKNVRDIYIETPNGTIYIDNTGNIFVVDEDGDRLATDQKLDDQEDLTEINLTTLKPKQIGADKLNTVLETLASNPTEDALDDYYAGKKIEDDKINVLQLAADASLDGTELVVRPGWQLDGMGKTITVTGESVDISNLRNAVVKIGEKTLYIDQYGLISASGKVENGKVTTSAPVAGRLTRDQVFTVSVSADGVELTQKKAETPGTAEPGDDASGDDEQGN